MKKVKRSKSVIKRREQDKVRREKNHMRFHTMRTYIKRAKAAKTDESFVLAQKEIAKCVKNHVVHRKTGSRLTSRLADCIK